MLFCLLGSTPRIILGSRTPHTPLSTSGPGIMWWSIQFDRVVRLIRVNKAYPGFPSPFSLFQAPRESGPLNWESANTKTKTGGNWGEAFSFFPPRQLSHAIHFRIFPTIWVPGTGYSPLSIQLFFFLFLLGLILLQFFILCMLFFLHF